MTLQQNTDHIQTTHIDSLPRPHNTNPHAQRLLSIASSCYALIAATWSISKVMIRHAEQCS
jgi:hypothetical protein